MTGALVAAWPELAGASFADCTLPLKAVWPRRINEDDPFRPATLTVACDGAAALRLQHQSGELVARLNAFLGFAAIERIRIVQKPVNTRKTTTRKSVPAAEDRRAAQRLTERVEDDALRASLEALGANLIAERKRSGHR